mgnify:CR=1 FL=1
MRIAWFKTHIMPLSRRLSPCPWPVGTLATRTGTIECTTTSTVAPSSTATSRCEICPAPGFM